VFLAWSAPEEIDTWLRRVGEPVRDADLARYRAAIETVRKRGYSVALEADARARLGRALAELGGDTRLRKRVLSLVEELGHEEYILGELSGAASYQVNHLAAPVFGAGGKVELALSLVGFTGQVDTDLVPRLGARLGAEASAVSAALTSSRGGSAA
jgi:DNA-binding IclR family transcriptional regulator